MLKIKLITLGSLSDRYFREAADEYIKRLSKSAPVTEIELKPEKLSDNPSQKEIQTALEKEAAKIKSEIPKRALVIAMVIEGKELSSEQLAEKLRSTADSGISDICFIIGSSYGMDSSIKELADVKLSMSKMTFPHKLARVMLLEQIYRANEINSGSKYHK